jgi:hypothetical protein
MSNKEKSSQDNKKTQESPEKASKSKDFTLTRIGKHPHQLLRKMAALDGVGMQELLDKLVEDDAAKRYPDL